MRTDDPAALVGHLGLIEDDMASIEVAHSEAAGREADFDIWHRQVLTAALKEFGGKGLLTHDAMGLDKSEKVTLSAKKEYVEAHLMEQFADRYQQHRQDAATLARLSTRFKSLDTRRSIGQTAMKPHLADEPKYGQGAVGQAGQ